MTVTNSLAKKATSSGLKHIPFQQIIKSTSVQENIMSTLGDAARTKRFTAALISAVSTNPQLQECSAVSTISAALLGESLNLSPSPQLGQYYMVPFNDKSKGKVATFQLGYKGMIQLAIRSGQYKKLNVIAVKEGELKGFDPFNEEIEVQVIENPDEREKAKTIGYYAMFELVNGFRKSMYWSKAKMESHAEKYSMGYKAHKGYTFWEKDFDGMAYKTMLRQLISKWGIMSIEMQTAYTNDMTFKESTSQEEAPTYIEAEEATETVQAIDAETGGVQSEAPAEEESESLI